MRLRILVADDHEVVRRGLCSLLREQPDWEVCAEAVDGREAVAHFTSLKPDVVLLDIGMPGMNGLEAARRILKADPKARILILTLHDSEPVVREALIAGARGFLLKTDAVKELIMAVEALRRGESYFTPRFAGTASDRQKLGTTDSGAHVYARTRLTARQREIVQLLVEGKSSKEVAVMLGLSVKTAETHRSNIMRKLDLHSISELVLYALKNNIVHMAKPEI